MTDVVNAVKNGATKVYKNGLTYAQNIQNGVFLPTKALKNHKEVMDKIDSVEKKMDLILSMIAKK